MKKITFLWSLLLLFVGVGAVKAQVEPQISTDETVYEYYMTSVSGVQLQVYSDNDANTLGYGSATERARVKIVSVETEAQDELYHIYVTNYEGHTAKVGASGTTDGTFITYGGTNNIWRKKQKEGDNNVWYFTLVDNDNVAFTAYGSKKIGLYDYTGHTNNGAYRWKFYPANANAAGGIDIESGYYTIHNVERSDKYLKNDVSVNAYNKTLQQTFSYPDNGLVKDQFIWKVDVDNVHFTLLNAQGTPVKVDDTTYPTMDVLRKMGVNTYVFTNYLNRDNSNDNTHTLHTYPTGGTSEENRWAFTKVEGTAYNVVLENELPGSLLKRTDTEGEVPEGGFFFVTQASGLTADAFKATLVPSGADNGRTPASVTIEGTTITVVYPQDENYKLFLLGEKIAHYESIKSSAVWGTTPGFYDEEKFTAALDKAKVFHDAGAVGHTPEEVVAVGETLDAEIAAALIKVTPGAYMIVSGLSNYYTNQGAEKAMVSDGGLKWRTSDAVNPAQYWIVEGIAGEEDAFYVRNLADGKYMQGTNSLDATSKSNVTFNYFSNNGKVQINVGGHSDLHTDGHSSGNGVSGDVIGWDGQSNNDASCWYIRPVDESELADVKTYQVVNPRVSTLEEGKKYVIYNTTKNDGGRYGYLYNNGKKICINKVTPSAKAVDRTYLWTLVADGNKWQIQSELTGKFVDIAGVTTHETGVSLNISEYTTAKATVDDVPNTLIKSPSVESYNDDATATTNITKDNHLWAVHLDVVNTNANAHTGCWNGVEGAFDEWSTAHPFAFYEVQEVTDPDISAKRTQTEELLAKDGVGYPVDAKRLVLENMKNTPSSTVLQSVIDDYKTTDDVKMPEDGKVYTITAVLPNDTKGYLYYTGTTNGYRITQTPQTDGSDYFICRTTSDGKFVFTNTAGKYFVWKGKSGVNGNKGYQNDFDATYSPVTLKNLPDRLGALYMLGHRPKNSASEEVTFILTQTLNGDSFDAYGGDHFFYQSNLTSALLIEEVENSRNKISFTKLNDENYWVATYSAPYPTRLPEGVKAYAVTATGETATTASLSDTDAAVEGSAIPANTGVLLTATEAIDPQYMAPATTEEAMTVPEDNKLVGTGTGSADVAGKYILASGTQGIAFYKATGTLGSYRAFISLDSEVKSFVLSFDEGELTGIADVEAATPAVTNEKIYDLSGRVVRTPQRGGLYIKGGKKFIQK